MSYVRFVLAAALTCAARVASAGQDFWVNPGTMGPNAVLTLPGDAATIPTELTIRVAMAGQRTAAGDLSATPHYLIEGPLGRWASMLAEGRPVEFWSVTQATREAWGIGRDRGTEKGDISFGVKFLLFDGHRKWPSFVLRNMTKTTTGKGYAERRHINSPAYQLDGLISWPFAEAAGAKLEGWISAGFLAWQQGADGQNDAFTWSATMVARWPGASLVKLEARGFDGWQKHDQPFVLAATAEWAVHRRVSLYTTANVGLRDAPQIDAHLGVVLRLPAHVPFGVDDAGEVVHP